MVVVGIKDDLVNQPHLEKIEAFCQVVQNNQKNGLRHVRVSNRSGLGVDDLKTYIASRCRVFEVTNKGDPAQKLTRASVMERPAKDKKKCC